jgi:hypothetical protein
MGIPTKARSCYGTEHSDRFDRPDMLSTYGGTEHSVRFGGVDVQNVTRSKSKRPVNGCPDRRHNHDQESRALGRKSTASSLASHERRPKIYRFCELRRWFCPSITSLFNPISEVKRDPTRSLDSFQHSTDSRRDHSSPCSMHCSWPCQSLSLWKKQGLSLVFGLHIESIVLVLFSANPVSLKKDSIIDNWRPSTGFSATVFAPHIFHPLNVAIRPHPATHYTSKSRSVPVLNSKFLNTFKLPCFDGAMSRNWKTWDVGEVFKSFQFSAVSWSSSVWLEYSYCPIIYIYMNVLDRHIHQWFRFETRRYRNITYKIQVKFSITYPNSLVLNLNHWHVTSDGGDLPRLD